MSSDALVEPFGAAVSALDWTPQQLSLSLHDATRQKAVEAFAPHSTEFESLELETMLWDLVASLSAANYSISVPMGNMSAELRDLVINWIQTNLNEPQEPANLQSLKWMYTRNQASKPKSGGYDVVSELDLDAPLRQARPIAEEDRASDEAFFKYVFELLLVGQYDTAETVCSDTNNWLLRAAVRSAAAASSRINGEGKGPRNRKASLSTSLVWKACHELSSSSIKYTSRYEAGIFGLLCDNLDAVAPLCESWESLLLAHLLCGASLETFERQLAQDHKLLLQGNDWRRRIALSLIQGRFPQLVDQLISEVSDPATAADSMLVNTPWLMRLLLHIEIASGQSADPILVQIYIEYLCQNPALLASRLDLAPVYGRLLSGDIQARVYGRILAQITDSDVQLRQVELSRRYNIDLASAIEYALNMNFKLYTRESHHDDKQEDFGSVRPSDSQREWSSPDAASARLVGILHWPVVAELWPMAARSLVRAYSLLFSDFSRRGGAVLLTSQISAEYVRNRAMDGIRAQIHEHPDVIADLARLRQYGQLGSAVTALDAWYLTNKDIPGWRSTAPKLIGQIIDAINQALHFGTPSAALYTVDDMMQIRRKYIPRLVYELLDVLRDAELISRGYAHVALEFAVKIADDNLKLYELFDAKLLTALAEPALAMGI